MARNQKSRQPASDGNSAKTSNTKPLNVDNSVAKVTGKATKSTNPLHARVKIQGDNSDPSSMA